MKKMKKLFAVLLALTMMLSAVSVFAEDASAGEPKVYAVEKLNLGNYTQNENVWGANKDAKITLRNKKVMNKTDEKLYISYTGTDMNDYLVQSKIKFDLTDDEGNNIWGGFTIRSKEYGVAQWTNRSNSGYLVVIKFDRIELQRWDSVGGQAILAVISNDGYVKDGVAVNISAGAFDTDDGVNIVVFADDKCILNVLDSSKYAVTEGEYFTIYATPGTEIGAYDGKVLPAIPAAPIVTKNEDSDDKYSAKYSIITFGKKAEGDFAVNWFYNDVKKGSEFTEIEQSAIKEFGSKYAAVGTYNDLNAAGTEYTIKPEEVDGFYLVTLTDAEGTVYAKSTPVIVESKSLRPDPVENILSNSIALILDCNLASAGGEKVQIDPDDDSIMPIEKDGRTLVPVRFVSERLGAEVGWNEETEEVTINLDGKVIVMTLGETVYTVDGEEKELDVPAMEINGRTRVPVRVISETFGKKVFWEETNELILISDEDLGVDAEKDIKTLNEVANKVKEAL